MHAASVHPEPGSNSLKIISKRALARSNHSQSFNRSVSFYWLIILVLHKNYCCTWKYSQINLQGFFSSSRCLIFKVRCAAVFQSAPIIYQIPTHLSTPFFIIFYPSSQLLRVFPILLEMLHKINRQPDNFILMFYIQSIFQHKYT